ncbi:MAG: DMT family transporter [Rhizobiaceae bacterium]
MSLFRKTLSNPYFLLTLTAIIWAGNAVAGRMAVGHVSPFLLTALRWTIAVAILLTFSLPYLKRDIAEIRKNRLFLFLLGAIGFTCFNILFYLALNYTTAINVAIIQASMPLMVFALNFIIFSIRATLPQIAGFVLTMIGVALTVTHGDLLALASQTFNKGDLIMLVAVLAYGGYSVMLVRKPDIHWISLITVLGISALLASLPFAAWEALSGNMIVPDAKGMAIALYIAVFPAIVSQLLWIRGLDMIGSNRGGVFINMVPIFASGLAVLLLGERFHAYHAAAIVLVVTGVGLSQRRQ